MLVSKERGPEDSRGCESGGQSDPQLSLQFGGGTSLLSQVLPRRYGVLPVRSSRIAPNAGLPHRGSQCRRKLTVLLDLDKLIPRT